MTAVEDIAGQGATRSQLREWGRLVAILLLVFSPLLLVALALEGLAWRIGETMPVSAASKWQSAAPDRIWRGGDGHSYLNYKLARIADLKPEVVALGPSRANFFHGDGFAPYSFFNAGLTAWTFDQYRRFLELIARDGYAPKVLMFNLDYWMFSSGFDHYWVDRFDERPAKHPAELLRVVAQLRADPLDLLRRLAATERERGLFAVLSDEGFHADGSLTAKPTTADPQRLAADSTDAGVPPVVLTDHIAPEQVERFDQFVALAKAKNIALIGVQMPFYGKILAGLNDNPQAGIWREFAAAEWRQRLAAAGVVFFDFADMPEFRDKPEYFIDSLDPDARVAGDVLRHVMADPRVRLLLPRAGDGK